jgi:predicted RND superfamily exporter protein
VSPSRRLAAALLAVTSLAVGAAATRLEFDNRLERWAGGDAALERGYARFVDEFGSDEFVLVVVEGADLLEASVLDRLLDAVERVEALPGVRRVAGVPTLYRDLFGAEDADALAEEVRHSPFFRDLFVSPDARALGLLVHVEGVGEPAGRQRLLAALGSALEALAGSGLEVRLVGSTVLGAALDELSEAEARRAFPVAMLGSLLALALLLRSWRTLLVVAACAVLAVFATLGLVALTGRSLNMVSAALPPLLWVLALANIVHLVYRLRDQPRELAPDRAV